MTGYIKKPHTAMFIGQTGCGKTHLVLELIEKEYNKHFDYMIIIYPTLRDNATYLSRNWIKNDDKVWLVEPKDSLYQWIQKLSEFLPFPEVLFIIDDIIANESLDKKETASVRIIYLRQASGSLFMVTNPVLYCHTKKFKKTGQGHFCLVFKGTRRSQSDTRGKMMY